MTPEVELAQLLIRMGTERGVDIEHILSEITWMPFPSFVDAGKVRASLLEVVESRWRADLEERLSQLRRQFAQGASEMPITAPIPSTPTPQSATAAALKPPADATIQEPAAVVMPEKDPSEALPRDATMIWTTQHG